MKKILTLFIALMLTGVFSVHAVETSSNKDTQAVYRDIQSTLGIVPTFMKHYPAAGIGAAWEEFKSVELSKQTLLSAKEKELIALSVAAQIPCNNCVYLHTESAKANGATEEEIRETIAMSAATRHWSTYLNGIQYNEADFKKETDTVVNYVKAQKDKPIANQVSGTGQTPTVAPVQVVDSKTAYQDIEQTLGSIPNYFKMFPENSIASAWKMMKTIQLNPDTSLSAKDKELIGLAVSAQVPCSYCTYFHTEAAKLNGASNDEVREALAMASLTRFWSTVINGNQMDEQKFKREVGQMLRYVKSQNKNVGMNTTR